MSSCLELIRSTATKSSIIQREGLEQVGRVGSQTALPMARRMTLEVMLGVIHLIS